MREKGETQESEKEEERILIGCCVVCRTQHALMTH